MKSFRDRIMLITGASSGIGRAVALRAAKFGARVVLASRNEAKLQSVEREITTIGASALIVPTDVTDSEQCREAVAAATDRFGRLDILINSAGLSMRGYFEGSQLQALEKLMHVNFFGTLYTTHFALPFIKESQGSLVALSSLTGKRGIPSYSVYGASKFAVQGFYEALRLELKRDGVHVGVVSPGFVDTPLRDSVLTPEGELWQQPPKPPFRIWPVEKCVDRIIRLIVKRRSEALLPWFAGPMLTLDEMLGKRIGDRLLQRFFPPDQRTRISGRKNSAP